MALDYTIDPDRRLVTISGEYASAEEWAQVLAQLVNDPRRQAGFGFLRARRLLMGRTSSGSAPKGDRE